jgi:UDP-3-O-[3-hydroxymyristoyl] glucosamine N-acyltransferase
MMFNVKIDKYVHIAHNATILENTILASSSKIMGSSHVGKNVFISAGVIVNNRVKIGDGCFIGPGEVVVKDVPPNSMFISGEITNK